MDSVHKLQILEFSEICKKFLYSFFVNAFIVVTLFYFPHKVILNVKDNV